METYQTYTHWDSRLVDTKHQDNVTQTVWFDETDTTNVEQNCTFTFEGLRAWLRQRNVPPDSGAFILHDDDGGGGHGQNTVLGGKEEWYCHDDEVTVTVVVDY